MKKLHLLFSCILALILCLTASGCDPAANQQETEEVTHRVMVTASEGVTVLPQAIQDVKEGESALFTIQFAENYVFESTDGGVFDASTNTLCVENVTSPMLITLKAEKVEYSTAATVKYCFIKTCEEDTSSAKHNSEIPLGTEITVRAGNTSRYFSGWKFGGSEEVVSTERSYTFRVTPELVQNGELLITPQYIDLNVYSYNENGGKFNKGTVNAKNSKYAKTKISGSTLTVTLSEDYLKKLSCATAFWNDGTFTRDGYILKEYNTKPDGSGEAYSPGAKFYQVHADSTPFVLYCIWEKADTSLYTYKTYTMKFPDGIKEENAPDWKTDGVIITGYTGDESTVAIPETIDGKTVIAIQSGAFKNKSFKTLLMPRTLQEVQNNAFTGCSSLETLYFPSGLWSIHNEAFDNATYSKLKSFIVYASIAPRFSHGESAGGFAMKLSYMMSNQDRNRIVVIAGSSSLQGLGSTYLEALMDHEYAVVNFANTRTTHGALYLEAMQHYMHEGDIVIYAPENSIYMMGDSSLYWKTLRDMEPLYQMFRYVDISNYDNMFNAFTEYNQDYAYKNPPRLYEQASSTKSPNKNGDDIKENKNGYGNSSPTVFVEAYNLSFNNRYKSVNEGQWDLAGNQKDYTDDTYWTSIDSSPYKDLLNHAIDCAKSSGATIVFGFAPADASAIIEEARNTAWLDAYDKMLSETYNFDAILGSCKNHIFAHEYFYDCAFHTNNYGRTWHTYAFYKEICDLLNCEAKYSHGDLGTDFDQCLFETDAQNKVLASPKYPVDFLK